MNTEKSQPSNSRTRAGRIPVSRKLQFVVVVFACVFFALLGLVYFSSGFSSAARAYVQGEGTWSKAQKEATIRLQEYAASRDEKDYQAFLDCLSVQLGDRIAREELEKPQPNYTAMYAGFRQGKIAEADIPGMITLFRKLRKTKEIDTAVGIWTAADGYIEEFRQQGAQLHEAIAEKSASKQETAALTHKIEETDAKLTPLENAFSIALSAGARRVERLLNIGLPLSGCLLLGLGVIVSLIVVQQVEASMAERGKAESVARESEKRYRELLENANDMIYVHDLEGNFISWNRKAEDLSGYKMSETKALRIMDLVAPEDRALAEEMLAKKLTGKGSAPYTLRLVSKEGKRHEVEVSSRLLYENGRATGVQGIARDLTERQRLEAELLQAQKMEAVGRLAGGIAHDFNNILMIVRGYAEILLERLHPEDPLHGQAAQIMKAGNRAAELTQRLLGFSRKQVFEPKILNVNDVVSEISKMLPTLLGAHVDFSLELSADAGNVNADPIQMEQVLINLAVNSRDAMPQGGKLIISTAARDLEGDTSGEQPAVLPGRYAEICVRDSGCGIDKETVRHIFEPFFTTKDKDKGTGLGLSTVYGIVKRSGGYILVSSEAAFGTTMRIYLPLVEREVESRIPDAKANGEMRGTGTVLIAEDEQALRELVGARMRAEGYKVLEAENGEEALAIAGRYKGDIQLLLTDVIMPKLRGPELASRLRLRYPGMKVIYMSGYTESALAQDGMLERNTVLLQKPFTVKKILEVIQQMNVNVRS
jgi:two-component system cell cycle sensor histidine kinase/response regulator CckA